MDILICGLASSLTFFCTDNSHGLRFNRSLSLGIGFKSKTMKIKIKPHHFIDIITSFSADKIILEPHNYGHNVHSVSKTILENRDTLLEIDLGADDICKPCIHNMDGICDDVLDILNRPKVPQLKRDWNLILDQRWCKRLKIDQGEII